jgi:hypothetical protein
VNDPDNHGTLACTGCLGGEMHTVNNANPRCSIDEPYRGEHGSGP